jgi:methylglutaconyl-CoA hydratase
VHQHVPLAELNSFGMRLANELLRSSPNAIAEAKILIHQVASNEMSDELIAYTAEHLAKMRTTKEGREGLQAFIDKRSPNW